MISVGFKRVSKTRPCGFAVNPLIVAFQRRRYFHLHAHQCGRVGLRRRQLNYEWHFDGRNPEPNHPHVFKEQGTYEVKLRVVDDSNEAGETKVVVTITDPRKRNTSRALRNAKRN